MKALAAILLLTSPAWAQASGANTGAPPACGPPKVSFDVKTNKHQHPPGQAEAGKALLYVIEDFRPAGLVIGPPTLKVGLDGNWVGATSGVSYMFFSAAPGEHHLCVNWQSHLKKYSRQAQFADFTAAPGQAYYFRARITQYLDPSRIPENGYLELNEIGPAEGQHLISYSALAASQPKK